MGDVNLMQDVDEKELIENTDGKCKPMEQAINWSSKKEGKKSVNPTSKLLGEVGGRVHLA